MFKDYFYGQKISEYGKRNGFVDYAALAGSFAHILNNSIVSRADDWEIVNGDTEAETEVFQYCIIPERGYEILEANTNELVMYSYDLDVFLWCVTHYGNSWDYVLTDIECEKEQENDK